MSIFKRFGRNKTDKEQNKVIIKAHLTGLITKLEDVPDEAFALKMIGDGIAIKPTSSVLMSPVRGKVIQMFPTNHALGIKTEEGLEILLHLGIDTVDLKGNGFEAFVQEGEMVELNDKLISIDWDLISDKIPSTISPIVITNMEMVANMEVLKEGKIRAADDLLAITLNIK